MSSSGASQDSGKAIIITRGFLSHAATEWRSLNLDDIVNFQYRSTILYEVNGDKVIQDFISPMGDERIAVPAGVCVLSIDVLSTSGPASFGAWSSIVKLTAALAAGRSYRVADAVQGDGYRIWLEDSQTGAKASSEAYVKHPDPVRLSEPNSVLYAPYVIPFKIPLSVHVR